MKKLFAFILVVVTLSCNTNPRDNIQQTGSFGNAVSSTSTQSVAEVVMQVAQHNLAGVVTVKGTIADYCKGEGCWLTLENKNGQPLFVEVENNAFVLPNNIAGKLADVQGVISFDTAQDGSITPKILANGITISNK